MIAQGGEVWVADETALREFPPLRAGGSKRGTPAHVFISGRNTRRPILGALNVATGQLVRTDDVLAAVEARETVRPQVPKLLIWDNAPSSPSRARCRPRGDHPRLPAVSFAGADAAGRAVARPEADSGRQSLVRLARGAGRPGCRLAGHDG